jgi:GNAT superfamily N-acetyltransferase
VPGVRAGKLRVPTDRLITVRPYRSSDLTGVVALWRASKRKAFPYVAVQQQYSLEEDTTHFRDVIAKECDVWLAEAGGEILGLMALKDDLIDQLFVRVDFQRQGIGAALLAKARELSPSGLRAYTFQKNQAARAFFEVHGFRVVSTGRSPPPENEPDLEYAWRQAVYEHDPAELSCLE